MNGRDEHTIKVEKSIKKYLVDKPLLIHRFYDSLAGKTAETKYNYVTKICNAFDMIYGKNNWDDAKVTKTTTEDINRFISQKSLKVVNNELIGTSAIATDVSILNNFFGFLEKNDYITSNPVMKSAGRPTTVNKKPRVRLTNDEIDIIFHNIETGVGSSKAINKQKHFKTMHKLIVYILLTTGIRIEALVNINISDIDFKNKNINIIEKRNKLRKVMLLPEVEEVLIQWLEERKAMMGDNINDTDAVFITKSNGFKRIQRTTVNALLKKYSEGIDKKISAHKFRHTAGTQVYQKSGGDLLLTQEFLGHADVQTTQIYAEHDRSKMADVISQIYKP